jgi:ribosomal protein S18 acetylase RimI-like enzyme
MACTGGLRMTVTYRDSLPADAEALNRIFDTVFCDTFAHLYRAEDLNAFLSSFGIADWRAQLSNRAFAVRVAQADGAPIAYVKLGPMKLPIEPDGPALLLDQLYVLKEHHGVGIARELMDWTIAEAGRRGAEQLFLTVYVDNGRARRLYERYGFEPVGRYDFMVGNHADEDIIMRKLL